MSASFNGHKGVVRQLLARGARQELQDGGFTALHVAVNIDHAGIVAPFCAAAGAAARACAAL